MREVLFIQSNKEQWKQYEKALANDTLLSSDYLCSMYLQVLNDLGYAQTFYPNSTVTQYLNALTAQIYQKIYKRKPIQQNRVKYFFKTEVPLIVYQYRSYLAFTVVIFFITVAIGVISGHYDQSFVRLVLGDTYINTTLDNIQSGDAMAIYKSGSSWSNTLMIAINNIYVGIRMFLYGIFAGIGTLIFLLYNGIMLGSFQYFFIAHNSFLQSFKGIWLHGFMEIIALIIEAFAGFILGASILFPKTYTRLQSFKIGFNKAFKIFIATIPFTITAAFIEGFITRYAKQMPDILNYLILVTTFGCIVYYFFIYPFLVHRKTQNSPELSPEYKTF